mmetsp:Transcript_60959/g.145269  ORF Transcript_60959/g.145269 Transcript_60959/m.145269 type:complete len:311 (+) Transcript_60959:115-1047(+)
MSQPLPTNPRALWYGAPDGDDSMRSPDEIRIIKEMCAQEVETFLKANSIDMGAANQLRREPIHVALAVIERGPLRACRDPSGVIVARMRDAKRGTLLPDPSVNRGPNKAAVPLDAGSSELDRWLAANAIDAGAAMALRAELPEVQRAVMAKGPLQNAANPSASLLARIRMVKEPGAMLAPAPPPPPEVRPVVPGGPLDLNDEVLKAVQKLQKKDDKPPPPPPPNPLGLQLPRGGGGGGGAGLGGGGMPMLPPSAPSMSWQPPEQPAAASEGTGAPPAAAAGAATSKIVDSSDKQLQDEALRIIQSMSYQD